MKFKASIMAAAAVMALAGNAQADGSAYVNVGVDTLEFDAWGVGGKLGYKFSDNFGVEGQLSYGVIADSIGGTDVGYDLHAAGYLVGFLPAGTDFEIIGRIGYHTTDLFVDFNPGKVSVNEDGIAYGVGGQYWIGADSAIRLDYTILDTSVGNGDTVSLAYVRKF